MLLFIYPPVQGSKLIRLQADLNRRALADRRSATLFWMHFFSCAHEFKQP